MPNPKYTRRARILLPLLVLTLSGCPEPETPAPEPAPERTRTEGVQRLPDGIVGREYVTALPLASAVGAVESEVVSGRLPEGLGLAGIWLRGRPRETGLFELEILVRDEIRQASFGTFVLEVLPPPPDPVRIPRTQRLPPCPVCLPYSEPLRTDGGAPPYAWEITKGELPEGLSLDEGTIAGTVMIPLREATRFTFTAAVTDSLGGTDARRLTLEVTPNPAVLLRLTRPGKSGEDRKTTRLPDAMTSRPYRLELSFSGGVAPLTWSVAEGALPDGITLADGILAGTAEAAGEHEVTLRLEDALEQRAERRFALTVLAPGGQAPAPSPAGCAIRP